MRYIYSNIPTSLGDIINIKAALDSIKYDCNEIRLNFHTALWNHALVLDHQKQIAWNNYIKDLGQLFFSEHPYILGGDYPFRDTIQLLQAYNIQPVKPELGYLLCKGESLNIGQYIVLTTKVRGISRNHMLPLLNDLWVVLRRMNIKIVLLGEREVERRKEYDETWELKNSIFGIYDQIISNIHKELIYDLTVPALGNTQSTLKQIQQDSLIMNQALAVITLGCGGNFCLASAVSNKLIGYRQDNDWMGNIVFNREYPNAIVAKDWNYFLNKLQRV